MPICADGYRIPFDTSTLSRPQLRGLLAVRDTELPAVGETHWLPYRHGDETIDFDPFYLVWAGSDESTDLDTKRLPWPFQITEIQRFDREADFAPARPPEGAADDLQRGLTIYIDHCGKCRSMRGVGGAVGRSFPTRPLWADQHTRTEISVDAGTMCRLSQEDAYRFARGEEVTSTTGVRAKLSRPLDWLVISDHAEMHGLMPWLLDGDPNLLATEQGERWYDALKSGDKSTR